MIYAFLAFVWLFLVLGHGTKESLKDLFSYAVCWMIALSFAGWVIGAILQVAKYGTVTAPAFQ